jgi:hypothetical protein
MSNDKAAVLELDEAVEENYCSLYSTKEMELKRIEEMGLFSYFQ